MVEALPEQVDIEYNVNDYSNEHHLILNEGQPGPFRGLEPV